MLRPDLQISYGSWRLVILKEKNKDPKLLIRTTLSTIRIRPPPPNSQELASLLDPCRQRGSEPVRTLGGPNEYQHRPEGGRTDHPTIGVSLDYPTVPIG